MLYWHGVYASTLEGSRRTGPATSRPGQASVSPTTSRAMPLLSPASAEEKIQARTAKDARLKLHQHLNEHRELVTAVSQPGVHDLDGEMSHWWGLLGQRAGSLAFVP